MLPVTDTAQQGTPAVPGRTLVMSHSFSFSRREWVEATPLLSRHFRTVAIDAPGHGEAADIPGYTMRQMARQFAATINELELTDYVLLGHSMTGKVMQILASREGKALGLKNPPAKLILLTPTPLGQEVGGPQLRESLKASARDRADAEQFVRDRSALPLPAEVFDRACEDYLRVNRHAWDAWLEEGVYEDWTNRCAPIDIETLLIVADFDPVWGLEMQRKETLPSLTRAEIVTIDAGHLVPMEAPEKLADLITPFASS
ncbi:alpha/beta fold hydrolase [Amycolatopsis pithecellobii]|nr:alpha/beta hydrolase [Amycolatopsis pithecellobii]